MNPRVAFLMLHGCRLYRLFSTFAITRSVAINEPVLMWTTTHGFWHRSRIANTTHYVDISWACLNPAEIQALSEKDINWICGL